jgi:hypothetical protein
MCTMDAGLIKGVGDRGNGRKLTWPFTIVMLPSKTRIAIDFILL